MWIDSNILSAFKSLETILLTIILLNLQLSNDNISGLTVVNNL